MFPFLSLLLRTGAELCVVKMVLDFRRGDCCRAGLEQSTAGTETSSVESLSLVVFWFGLLPPVFVEDGE